MADYIVTGAAGFIGRNLVAALNARGDTDLLLVDDLGTSEKWKNLVGLQFERLLGIDDFSEQLRQGTVDPPKTLIHLGACSATTERNADYLRANNTDYTRLLCQWAVKHSTRFVYASSAATYGNGELGYCDADTATPNYQPLNMYGYSKHLFDLWALRHNLLDRIVGLKYFNVYGPWEDHKGDMRSVVHKAFHQIKETGKLGLFKSYKPDYADGEQKRDFVFVDDAVDVTLYFADHPEVSGLFNCGTGEARTWLDLARAVFAAMDREPNIEFIDMPKSLREKYQYFTQSDPAKLRAAGYDKPFTSLEKGVEKTIREYLTTR